MKISRFPSNITNTWFFRGTPLVFTLFQMYIWGDVLVLLPFIFGIGFVGLFSQWWMLALLFLLISFRALGEMIYWLLQQFGPRSYRPYDFGCTKLDNHAIYILYQLISLTWLVVGVGVLIYLCLHAPS